MHKIDLNKPIQYSDVKGKWLDCELLDANFNSGGLILRAYKATQESGNQFVCYLDPENKTCTYWRNKPKTKVKVGVIVFKFEHGEIFSVIWSEALGPAYLSKEHLLEAYKKYKIITEFEKEIEID